MKEQLLKKINIDNWTHCAFYSKDYLQRVLISCGAYFCEEKNDIVEEYYNTILDNNDQFITQSKFSSLNLAIETINQTYYSNWIFKDAEGEAPQDDGSGCSSCSAH